MVEAVKKPLEEAPFGTYLKILRENGHEMDAEISESFYIELLTTPFEDEKGYTREQIMVTPFKDVCAAAEKLLDGFTRDVASNVGPVSSNGPILAGPDADKLKPEQLRMLASRQVQEVENEKQRILAAGGYRFG